jgi:glycine cleavage system H protein
MDAGVVAYKLCDRGFTCETCPFDSALRGQPAPVDEPQAHEPRVLRPWTFPPDRLYTDAHLWVQNIRPGQVRAGIDQCAAGLLPPLRRVLPAFEPGTLRTGDPLCILVVEGGEVPIGTPVGGCVCRWNDELDRSPGALTDDPYAAGWLVELARPEPAGLAELLSAGDAHARAQMDARRFQRGIAFHLLSAEPDSRPSADLDAVLRLVGPGPVVATARQILH